MTICELLFQSFMSSNTVGFPYTMTHTPHSPTPPPPPSLFNPELHLLHYFSHSLIRCFSSSWEWALGLRLLTKQFSERLYKGEERSGALGLSHPVTVHLWHPGYFTDNSNSMRPIHANYSLLLLGRKRTKLKVLAHSLASHMSQATSKIFHLAGNYTYGLEDWWTYLPVTGKTSWRGPGLHSEDRLSALKVSHNPGFKWSCYPAHKHMETALVPSKEENHCV